MSLVVGGRRNRGLGANRNRASMAGFLDRLQARYGGGAGYLTAHGIGSGELAALRTALVMR